jgi:transcriptional regulator with XRE-family HTH domain
LIITGEQFRAARAMARIEQVDLALQANVSVETIKRLERTEGPVSANVQTVDAVTRALEAAGIEFTNGEQPGVRLRKQFQQGDYARAAQFGTPIAVSVSKDHNDTPVTTITVPTTKRRKEK